MRIFSPEMSMTAPLGDATNVYDALNVARKLEKVNNFFPTAFAGIYGLNQYEALIRNVLFGCRLNRSLRPWPRLKSVGLSPDSSRPCCQTKKIVEPGLYSHRTTV